MHAERDIVLPIPSVCLSNGYIVHKRRQISSHLFDILVGHHFSFLSPTAVTKISMGTPSAEVLNTQGSEK